MTAKATRVQTAHRKAVDLVGQWLDTFPDTENPQVAPGRRSPQNRNPTVTTFGTSIGYPYTLSGHPRDPRNLRAGLTWLNWCRQRDIDPLHASRPEVELWWDTVSTAPSLTTPTRLNLARALASWSSWAVKNQHTDTPYGPWIQVADMQSAYRAEISTRSKNNTATPQT